MLKAIKEQIDGGQVEETPEDIALEFPDAEDIEATREQAEAEHEAKANAAFAAAFTGERRQARNMYIVFHPGKPEFESEMMFTTAGKNGTDYHDDAHDDSTPSDWSAHHTDAGQHSEGPHSTAHDDSTPSDWSAHHTDAGQHSEGPHSTAHNTDAVQDTDEPDISDTEIDQEDTQDNSYQTIVRVQAWPGQDWPPKSKRNFPINKLPADVKKEDNCPGSAAWNSGVEYIFNHKGKVITRKLEEKF
jgi:hypothetical protein